jgi:aminoglycoside phosphotransferase (APT) family kinase protein
MSRIERLAIESNPLADHPAARAWKDLGGQPPARIELLRKASRTKPAIYRLAFASARRPGVFAKRSRTADLALERHVYERILPRLPVTVPRCFGSLADPEGSVWLFVEDVGDARPVPDDPAHRVLASQWLGILHRWGAAEPAAAALPDAGPARYLGYLRTSREQVRRHFGNPALGVADRTLLTRLLEQLDALESLWQDLDRACRGLPSTLVHGDFRAKNVRLRVVKGKTVLYTMDWEMAGFGIPAADLGCGPMSGLTLPIDFRVYRETIRELWPDLDAAAIRRLSMIGRIFQALAGTRWACASLVLKSPRSLIKPVGAMRHYREQLSEAIEASAGWLE